MRKPRSRIHPLLLLLAYWPGHACLAQTSEGCDTLTRATSDETLVAWNSPGPVLTRWGTDGPWETQFGQLRVVAVVKDGQVREPRNAVLEKGEVLWNVLNAQQELALSDIISFDYLLRPGISYCLFSAEIDTATVDPNALFTNDRNFRLRPPTDAEQAVFDAVISPRSYCANRAGAYVRDGETPPPCKVPELLGLSDVDGNGNPEFWTTEVLRYSTGIAVWENDGRRYEKIFSACPLCGD